MKLSFGLRAFCSAAFFSVLAVTAAAQDNMTPLERLRHDGVCAAHYTMVLKSTKHTPAEEASLKVAIEVSMLGAIYDGNDAGQSEWQSQQQAKSTVAWRMQWLREQIKKGATDFRETAESCSRNLERIWRRRR